MELIKMADFDPDKYLSEKSSSGGFDPDQYLASKTAQTSSDQPEVKPDSQQWSKLQSAGQGILQGSTAGFSDELGGALGALQEKVLPGGNADKKSIEDLYKEYRDMHRARNNQAEQANPKSYLAGNVAGGIGSAIAAPEALAAKGTSVGGAAALGATNGLGASDSDTLAGDVKNTAIGAGLGAAAGKVGEAVSGALNPEALESGANKAAGKALGLKPSKDLTTAYDAASGRSMQGSNVVKGIGKTALEQDALPLTGGAENMYDKSLDAINNQYNKLNPLVASAQEKLNENLPQHIENAGPIADKAANFMENFNEGLSTNPDQAAIMKKITDKYTPFINQIAQSDGNLQQLVAYKKGIQDYAQDLSAAAYSNPASDLKPEAAFVKQFGGVLRQHIEDLASSADEGAGDQINDINKTLGNLYNIRDLSKKLLDKSSSSVGLKDALPGAASFALGGPMGAAAYGVGKVGLEAATGNPLSRLSNIAQAKALNSAAKAVQTPAGELVQKVVTNAPMGSVTNPFVQSKVQNQNKSYNNNSSEAADTATNLYNATDDSLRSVADSLSKNPGTQFYGSHLAKAIDSNDNGEKNRAIFLILQNPQSRKLISPEKK